MLLAGFGEELELGLCEGAVEAKPVSFWQFGQPHAGQVKHAVAAELW